MKKLAPKPYFFRSGRATVWCDFTASSNVRTTSRSGTGSRPLKLPLGGTEGGWRRAGGGVCEKTDGQAVRIRRVTTRTGDRIGLSFKPAILRAAPRPPALNRPGH